MANAPYEKEHFEAGFQLITAVAHQIIKIDFTEMSRWIDTVMTAKGLNTTEEKRNLLDLQKVMEGFHALQKTLYAHGIPVRDISNYKEVTVPHRSDAIVIPNP